MASISKVGSRGHHKFTLTLTEGAYSIANNTSPVSFAFKLVTTGGAWDWAGWGTSISYKITINGTSYSGYIPDYNGTSTLTVRSGKQTIEHNADGTKTISYSFSVTDNAGKTYTCGNASESGTMKLSDIPRQATLTSAPNFNDTSDPQIKYSNPAGIAADLEVAIYNSTGSQSYVPYRYVSSTGNSYVFTLTPQERTNLLKAATTNTLKVRFYIKTVLNGKTYLDYLDRKMTVKDADPIVTPSVKRATDNLATTLTGDDTTLIRYYSAVEVSMDVKAQKNAAIDESLNIIRNGKTSIYAKEGTFPDVEDNIFYFSAEDSRGNTTIKKVKMEMVDYVKPTCSIIHNIPDGDGDMAVQCYGDCFTGSFGKYSNTLAVAYRYKEQGGTYGSWTNMTVTLGDNVYAASATVSGLDYQKTYVFQTRASDSVGSMAWSGEDIVKAKPLFHWGENDFVFEVPVECKEGIAGIESGSWSPTLSVTPTSYDIRRGGYLKIGNMVVIGFTIKAAIPSGYHGTTVNITGVPYNPLASGFGGGVAHNIYISSVGLNFEGWHIGTSGQINARLQPCNNTTTGNLNISSTAGYPNGGGTVTLAGTICYITST